MSQGKTERLIRQLRIVHALGQRRRGATARQLADEMGVHRSTLYRDLGLLAEAGVPIAQETINGEARYALCAPSLPPLEMTERQIWALLLAEGLLAPLRGTEVFAALDELLERARKRGAVKIDGRSITTTDAQGGAATEVNALVDRAIRDRRRLSLTYHSTRANAPQQRLVEPVQLLLREGQVYLVAWDVAVEDWRTFKATRVTEVERLDEPASAHPPYVPQELHQHSVGVWSGEPIAVAVRIVAPVARFIEEWPLADGQVVEALASGDVIVRATVAGPMEVMRWVLRWGRNAEVLEPASLREQVREELLAAGRPYLEGQ